jgi:DNA-binding NarL/FixJ family response regulator
MLQGDRFRGGKKMPRWSAKEEQQLIAWYEEGVPLIEIARRLHRSYSSVAGKFTNCRGKWQVEYRHKPS